MKESYLAIYGTKKNSSEEIMLFSCVLEHCFRNAKKTAAENSCTISKVIRIGTMANHWLDIDVTAKYL